MSAQTALNIFLSVLSAFLAVNNFIISRGKDSTSRAIEINTIEIQLQNVLDKLREMHAEIKKTDAGYDDLMARVVTLEARVNQAFQRIERLASYHKSEGAR